MKASAHDIAEYTQRALAAGGSYRDARRAELLAESSPTKTHKYRAEPTVVDGVRFASKKEAKRYGILKALEKAGAIVNLELQPRFPIYVNRVRICDYYADFRYWLVDDEKLVIEDVKGVKTPVYRLKKKLVEAIWHIEIKEV